MGCCQVWCLRVTNDCIRAALSKNSRIWRTSGWHPFNFGDDTLRVDNLFVTIGHFVTCRCHERSITSPRENVVKV